MPKHQTRKSSVFLFFVMRERNFHEILQDTFGRTPLHLAVCSQADYRLTYSNNYRYRLFMFIYYLLYYVTIYLYNSILYNFESHKHCVPVAGRMVGIFVCIHKSLAHWKRVSLSGCNVASARILPGPAKLLRITATKQRVSFNIPHLQTSTNHYKPMGEHGEQSGLEPLPPSFVRKPQLGWEARVEIACNCIARHVQTTCHCCILLCDCCARGA